MVKSSFYKPSSFWIKPHVKRKRRESLLIVGRFGNQSERSTLGSLSSLVDRSIEDWNSLSSGWRRQTDFSFPIAINFSCGSGIGEWVSLYPRVCPAPREKPELSPSASAHFKIQVDSDSFPCCWVMALTVPHVLRWQRLLFNGKRECRIVFFIIYLVKVLSGSWAIRAHIFDYLRSVV